MKTKNKMIASLEIAIVLCSVFLMALPAIAADQNQEMQKVSASANTITTAPEDDFVLGVYGNANEDDTIDMRDLTYVKLIFFGKKPETELADAKYDGKINSLDFIQIKLIIVDKERKLTIIDSEGRIVTVKKPIKRIVMNSPYIVEVIRSIKATDKIVAVDKTVIDDKPFFPEFGEYPNVGFWRTPDIEMMLDLQPDVVFLFTFFHPAIENAKNQLESAGVTVLCFDGYKPEIYMEEVRKLGYILGRKKEANDFINFYERFLNIIEEKVEELSEEDKPKVYLEAAKPYRTGSAHNNKIAAAGGKSIFSDSPDSIVVDPEVVLARNPEIIVYMPMAYQKTSGYDLDTGDTTKLEEIRDEIMSRPELQKVKAVETGRVYIISNHIYGYIGPGGPRFFVGIGYMAKWFHPDLFEDLDPKAIHQEYITRFQGLDIDFDERGVFVYPPLES
jgi:iron complex transport system substrate-binding protein